ncbi:MAG: hypothetical protein Q9187_002574 [Circinaria calcarea]
MNLQPSSTHTAATLRPRNRRLVSIDDQYETIDTATTLQHPPHGSATSSIQPSRAASPIPSSHPSRSTSANRDTQRLQLNGRPLSNFSFGGSQATPTTFATGLWETSWSSLQGIASNLLGNDIGGSSKDKASLAFGGPRKRRPLEATHGKWTSSSPDQWGPKGSADKQIASGSKEDRLAQLQAKKREMLLAANGHAVPDSSGRYKRRNSGAGTHPPSQSLEQDQDALVYLHHVQPNDTLAGVTIKYNCPAAMFRKANRLWPNDSIQIRKTVYLPIEACGVKGRKIATPVLDSDLLNETDGAFSDLTPRSTPTTPRAHYPYPTQTKDQASSGFTTSPSISVSNPDEDPPPWIHDSWVLLPNSPVPIEIARLPRQTLGFFPPSRRKSQTYTDDISPTPPLSRASSRSPPQQRQQDDRRHQSRSSSGSHFVSHLQGPGGVGTLGREVRSPGPAQDGLNKLFAPHLPSVAPRASFESEISMTSSATGTGIENVGGAIEGWVRKIAGKAAGAIGTPPLKGGGAGDLIELVDAFELDEGGEDLTGGSEASRGRVVMGGFDGDEEEGQRERERELRERFPPRGRVFVEERKGKGTRKAG